MLGKFQANLSCILSKSQVNLRHTSGTSQLISDISPVCLSHIFCIFDYISQKSQNNLRYISGIYLYNIAGIYQTYLRNNSGISQTHLWNVQRIFQVNIRHISGKHQANTLNLKHISAKRQAYIRHILGLQTYLFTIFIPHYLLVTFSQHFLKTSSKLTFS